MADALSAAHHRNIVHRDIKPENILLSGNHARVADFGIARAVSAAGGARLTSAGMAIGTPSYMSPEQASGDENIDARSDLYSLGCVLYEMLAGEPPYSGPDDAGDPGQAADRAGAAHFRPAGDGVARAGGESFIASLAKAPADRPATAAALIAELDAAASGRLRRPTGRARALAWNS